MIKNANIAPDAGIEMGKIAGGFGGDFFVPNNIRRVIQVASYSTGTYYRKIVDMMPSSKVYTKVSTAVAACDESDVVYVHAGDAVYESEEIITISAPRVKLFGQQAHWGLWGSPSIHVHSTDTVCLRIRANQAEIAGLGFHCQTANVGIQVGYAEANWRTFIHDCYFGGNDTATYGIDCGLTYDAPYTVISNCKFEGWITAAVRMNAHHSVVQGCQFNVYTAVIGLEHIPNGGDRPHSQYLDNRFWTTDSTNAYGIKVTNTPTAGMVFIDGNRFVNFHGDDHSISKRTQGYIGRNWLDDGGASSLTIQEA